ncbi:DUF4160 domain-containing protein [bacterium]|nr:DUF4160 domain-containing protein [bacterium]
MPRISYFLGIAIYMYFRDHEPPHFHAMYGEFAAMVAIADGEVLAGKLPARVSALVKEWALLNKELLLKNWEIARQEGDLIPVPPLE